MNKFEALAQFQSWPQESQRLCAEYWIETGEVEPKFVLAFPKPAVQSPRHGDPIPMPSCQPKAPKVAAVKPARNNMRYTRDELIEVDSHVSEGRGPMEVACIIDRKYPNQRTLGAWAMMVDRIKKKGLQAMLERAIDVEFK